ncbi:hypothetical protein M0802_005790 [Mischocyttarus mexicanus]|nr:hypothetical protein M0802_005790 [Mischocyttarus mexicanus]
METVSKENGYKFARDNVTCIALKGIVTVRPGESVERLLTMQVSSNVSGCRQPGPRRHKQQPLPNETTNLSEAFRRHLFLETH